jgi:diadenosine tetraphosphate (Ap4A) HIT family hydrolase
MVYDSGNIFAKILRGELSSSKVLENEYVLAFNDVFPKAPIHILVIPKGAYVDGGDFFKRATDIEVVAFTRAIATIVESHGLEKTGYRLISNAGVNGGQEVPHFHMHILGGKALGPMVSAH